MSRRYLRKEVREELKEVFTLCKRGFIYKPRGRTSDIVLTPYDIGSIHDFLLFQDTQEYREWLRHKPMSDYNGL